MFQIFGILVRFLKLFKLSVSSNATRGQPGSRESQNIVILGSLGIGKSSLVNMIVGKAVAPVSSEIGVAHAPIVEYTIRFSEISGDSRSPPHASSYGHSDPILKIYDTLGLDHRPSPWDAIKARLKRSGGVDVVIYCMRRGRLSNVQVTHLDTIWKTLCRGGEVPLVLVVSDSDYQHGSTQQWWEANGEHLENSVRVRFADHICMNTWDPSHPSWEQQGARYEESQRQIRDLVIRHCKGFHPVV